MITSLILALGFTVGILVGLLGIGGGVVLVPAMVYLLGYDQHLAQGTSLFILLPPIGLGALGQYWKDKQVDLRAGAFCASGFLLGGYGGGKIAVPMPSNMLKGIFGCFLILAAFLLLSKASLEKDTGSGVAASVKQSRWRSLGIFFAAGFCGFAAGLVGIGGGVLLVPMLGLLFGFTQHKAQGTSLVALIPPTGLLAFLVYWKHGYVSWQTGLLLIPGVFLGGILGGLAAQKLNPGRMRWLFAVLILLLGGWQVFSAWRR